MTEKKNSLLSFLYLASFQLICCLFVVILHLCCCFWQTLELRSDRRGDLHRNNAVGYRERPVGVCCFIFTEQQSVFTKLSKCQNTTQWFTMLTHRIVQLWKVVLAASVLSLVFTHLRKTAEMQVSGYKNNPLWVHTLIYMFGQFSVYWDIVVVGLRQIWRHSFKALLWYRVHKNGTDVRSQ